MRRADPIPDDVAAALRSVDDALASGTALADDPAERELQELALALEADAPRPAPEFAERMDRRVAERFRGAPGARRARLAARPRLLALGAAVTVLIGIAAVGAVTQLTGHHGRSERQFLASGDLRRPHARPFADTAALPTRRVERAATLSLVAPANRIDRVADGIVQTTDRHRGFVLSSSVSSGESNPGGNFELRVPSGELEATLRDLSQLAAVRARNQSGQDVTGEFTSVTDRLNADLVLRKSLLRQLAHAGSTGEADRLRTRLDSLGLEMRQLRSELAGLRKRTGYATVSVTLVGTRNGSAALGEIGDALRGGGRSLVASLALVLRVGAAVLPFALLAALAWAGANAVRRRRREAVLS
jgi:Domain of unknown function (DUF4349)